MRYRFLLLVSVAVLAMASWLSMSTTLAAERSGEGLVRGPYLQRVSHNAAIIRWRTAAPCATFAAVGGKTFDDATPRTDHSARITGLQPETVYDFAIGDGLRVLAGGHGCQLRTRPVPGTDRPTRIWVVGDPGHPGPNVERVCDSYRQDSGARHTDVWLLLGDSAYARGSDQDFQVALFDTFGRFLRNTCVWPAFGNHEARSSNSAEQTGPFFDAFDLPTEAECGGEPSLSESYYSFDHGNTHFVCLDSHGVDRSPEGAMLSWLRGDLQQVKARWLIAFFHHPPFSSGSHETDNPDDSQDHMGEMRRNALPILEAAGVDLVLAGHSHSYERSLLLHGHYGPPASFSQKHVVDIGCTDDHTFTKKSHRGTIYIVAGNASKLRPGSLGHPAMPITHNRLGSLVIEIDGKRLNARFLAMDGSIQDSFAIHKR